MFYVPDGHTPASECVCAHVYGCVLSAQCACMFVHMFMDICTMHSVHVCVFAHVYGQCAPCTMCMYVHMSGCVHHAQCACTGYIRCAAHIHCCTWPVLNYCIWKTLFIPVDKAKPQWYSCQPWPF